MLSDKLNLHTPPVDFAFARRLIVALDVDTADQAVNLVQQLSPLGVMFKVGMQLFYKAGMPLVQQLQANGGQVFVDLKLHDIPNTVGQASATLVSQGVRYFNVHTQGGPEMMQAAVKGAHHALPANEAPTELTILGVTLLTSISSDTLKNALSVHSTPSDYVLHLAKQAQEAGLSGVVCSAQEAGLLRRSLGSSFLLVTPGIRPAGSDVGDQMRVQTPKQAMISGASAIVVGRPITAASDPIGAAQAILQDMKI